MTTADLLPPQTLDKLQEEKVVVTAHSVPSSPPDFKLDKSASLAERRKLQSSPKKLKLYTTDTPIDKQSNQTLQRLQEENAKLPPQVYHNNLFKKLNFHFQKRILKSTCWLV